MYILVTGTAGFIGMHLSQKLLSLGYMVIGIDNLNEYYDITLKRNRLGILMENPNFHFENIDITDIDSVKKLFESFPFNKVIHLAAQAGVRYSIENPFAYLDSNVHGFLTILEACKDYKVSHLLYASSSSVYGNNKNKLSETEDANSPVSLYATTKRSNELMAYTYNHLYNIRTTGMRFFTVYGPWGRPDMAYYKFTKSIIEGLPIQLYNYGNLKRDFTYIDDIIKGIMLLFLHEQDINNKQPNEVYNIGNSRPYSLNYFINTLENVIGKRADRIELPMQLGDVVETYADISKIRDATGYKPKIELEVGLTNFVRWYVDYHKEK
ncbi:NAD-dependent epimerase/dehydratase family protein [Bacillus salitolerans]|uniref:NAD-dependent epimerase/dehydratase family protein n=1 Tax=Bacillus salitolerans TaxID=1437434 RepID=A0ABW4LNQ2_9BACI